MRDAPQLEATDARGDRPFNRVAHDPVRDRFRSTGELSRIDALELRQPGVLPLLPPPERSRRVVGQAIVRSVGDAIECRLIGVTLEIGHEIRVRELLDARSKRIGLALYEQSKGGGEDHPLR